MATSPMGLPLQVNAMAEWCDSFNMGVNCFKAWLLAFTALRPVNGMLRNPWVSVVEDSL